MNIYLHQPLLSRRDKIRRKMGYPDIGTVNCLFTTTKFIRLDIWGMTFLFPYQKVSQSRVFIRTNLTSRPNWIDYPQKRVKSQYWRWVLSTNLMAPSKTRTQPHTTARNARRTHTDARTMLATARNAHNRTHNARSCVRYACVLCALCVRSACGCVRFHGVVCVLRAFCVRLYALCAVTTARKTHAKRSQNARKTHTERTQNAHNRTQNACKFV